ncbi:MAG: hypothetical protein HY094_01660 [Candidatus Melainabacteria bacterium]|nr:hypothetical protein [Candidatus Melainabacteria bacterium]
MSESSLQIFIGGSPNEIAMNAKKMYGPYTNRILERYQKRTMVNDSEIESIKAPYRKPLISDLRKAQREIIKLKKQSVIKDKKQKEELVKQISGKQTQIDSLNKQIESAGEGDKRVIGIAAESGLYNKAILEAQAILQGQDPSLYQMTTSKISADNREAKNASTRTDITMPSFLPFMGALTSSS